MFEECRIRFSALRKVRKLDQIENQKGRNKNAGEFPQHEEQIVTLVEPPRGGHRAPVWSSHRDPHGMSTDFTRSRAPATFSC